MSTTIIDGIETNFEVVGSGEPILLYSPGGFGAEYRNWSEHGIYGRIALVETLSPLFTCMLFDRREAGASGGRVERIGWDAYVRQGIGLLDHLGVESAHVIGGCVGCSIAARTAVLHPERVRSMILYSPAGGPRYRMSSLARFASHEAFVRQHGLAAVVERARTTSESFSADPLVGPWVNPLRRDDRFAADYSALPVDHYLTLLVGMARLMFDRDTVPGFEPEDLMTLDIPALIVPGDDRSHAPSAAAYLMECLAKGELWDVPVAEQKRENAGPRVIEFLQSVEASR